MHYLAFIILHCFSLCSLAQQSSQPKFKGGDSAFYSFSAKHIKPTPEFIRAKVTGRTFVSFRVNANGEIDSIRIVKPFGFGMDEEVVRFLKLTSGQWIPAQSAGKPIATFINMPFRWHPDD